MTFAAMARVADVFSWRLCSYLDGTVYDGEWVMGVRCGKAMVTHANGSVFDGSYDNDVACGQGSFAYPGGQIEVKGTWLQGQLHGEVRLEDVDCSLQSRPADASLCR